VEPAGRATVGIIGVGRAGAAVGVALQAAGHVVVAVHTRSTGSAARAALLFPAARREESAAKVTQGVDLVLLAVPDDALAAVAAELATATKPAVPAASPADPASQSVGRPVVAHLSGRHGLAVLAPLRDRLGLPRAAIHPVMTLSGSDQDAELLRGAAFGITADAEAAGLARRLVLELGGRPIEVPEAGRAAYHAALTLAANFGATLVAEAADLLRRAGVSEPAAALGPLVRQSLAAVLADGEAAMTGPVRRGDAATVRAHQAALAAAGSSSAALAAYRAVGLLTAERLARAGVVDERTLEPVVAALGGSV
jgi:predicted short-subunit dehydrogenase-like oxidoreductase (DUF2520 family)